MEVRIKTKSSQASDRLAECCAVLDITSLKVVQDVETRLWSTKGLVECLLYVMEVINFHERLDGITTRSHR